MATIKVLLKKNKIKANGEIPIYIRITKNRKPKFISTGISITEDQWDEKNKRVKKHNNKARINALLATKIAEAQNLALELETKNKYVSADHIKNKLLGATKYSFTNYYKMYKSRLLADNKIGTHDKVKAVFNKLEAYTQNRELQFREIDIHFLNKYEAHLRDKLGNSTNTIHSNLKIFRKLFNDAIREEIIDPDQSPFLKYKLKTEKTQKEYLTEEELLKFETIDLKKDQVIFHHRNMYVFACYAGGMRISDILQLTWEDFSGSHITIIMQKTKDVVSVKLPTKALAILEYYKETNPNAEDTDYIFPCLDNDVAYNPQSLFSAISSATAYINKNLKTIAKKLTINKNISFHTSRHTWATRALRKGMRIEYVSKLMGHSSIKTTQIYSKIVNAELDNAMDVFN